MQYSIRHFCRTAAALPQKDDDKILKFKQFNFDIFRIDSKDRKNGIKVSQYFI